MSGGNGDDTLLLFCGVHVGVNCTNPKLTSPIYFNLSLGAGENRAGNPSQCTDSALLAGLPLSYIRSKLFLTSVSALTAVNP